MDSDNSASRSRREKQGNCGYADRRKRRSGPPRDLECSEMTTADWVAVAGWLDPRNNPLQGQIGAE